METVENISSLYHTKKYVSDNKYFVDSLKFLKERIESTNSFHQIEILRIFNDNGVLVNENKNGVFINLTYVDSPILDKVYKYLSYVNKQEDQLNEIEKEKEKIVTSFFKWFMYIIYLIYILYYILIRVSTYIMTLSYQYIIFLNYNKDMFKYKYNINI